MLAPGERLKSIEIRVASALMEHAQFLFDRYGAVADPYMTLVDYFTSTRELAGMRRLVEDEVGERLRSRQVRTKRRQPEVQELTGRMPSNRIAESLAELETPFDPRQHSTAAMDALREENRRDPDGARARAAAVTRPIDVLLATSMLQVGVDVQRLGLMVVTGQPKNTAEYIQATSRVGRSRERPGLVVTIYQWSRPRDLAHYESFWHDHATFGLHVEGLTTTPFSDRALDRGLTGVLVTALRHSGISSLPNAAAHSVPLSGPLVAALINAVGARAEMVTHDSDRGASVRAELQHRLDHWYARRQAIATGHLGYKEAPDISGLLRDPDEASWDLWSAPMSMREVEAEILLQLDRDDRSMGDAPGWSYERTTPRGPGTSRGRRACPRQPGPASVAAAAAATERRGSGPTRIGNARPSHLITTAGVGATMDLPSMSVIVRGLEAWNPEHQDPVEEPRLLEAVQRVLGPQVRALRHAPWDPSASDDPYTRTGVPVTLVSPVDALPALLPARAARPTRTVRAGAPVGTPARPGEVRARAVHEAGGHPCATQARVRSGPFSSHLRRRAPGRLPLRGVRPRHPHRGGVRGAAAHHVGRGLHARAAGHRQVRDL